MFSQPFNLDRTVRLIISVVVAVCVILLIGRLSDVLLPFFAAWLAAYMLNPFVEFLQEKVHINNRLVCVIIVMLTILGMVIGVSVLAAQSIEAEIDEINELIREYLDNEKTFNPFVDETIKSLLSNVNLQAIDGLDDLSDIVRELMPTAYGLFSSSLQYLAGVLVLFFFMLYLFFIMMDLPHLSSSWQNLCPRKFRPFARQLFHDLAQGMNMYFRKQALISLILGCLFAAGFTIIDLPMGVAMGLLVGLLNMIPYMHTLGIIPPMVVALIQSAQTNESFWLLALWIVAVFCINQLILDLILTPKIMGKATGLNPAVLLLSLSIWGSLLGVLGMIIALPVTSLMVSYYKHFIIGEKNSALEEITKAGKEGKEAVDDGL